MTKTTSDHAPNHGPDHAPSVQPGLAFRLFSLSAALFLVCCAAFVFATRAVLIWS